MKLRELFSGYTRNGQGLVIRLSEQHHLGAYALHMFMPEDGQRKALSIVEVEVEERGPAELLPESLTLNRDAAQELFDDMWRSGLRPSDHYSGNETAAVRGHLADMRAIVSHNLKVTLPETLRQ